MKKIAIIASFNKSIAIWNATRMHIQLMKGAGHSITIFVQKGQGEELIDNQFINDLVLYNNIKEAVNYIKVKDLHEIWCPTLLDVIKMHRSLRGYKHRITFWVQGTEPDESYMRHKSRLRRFALRVLERLAFKYSDNLVFVSDAMYDFYVKYKLSSKNIIVIPCLSEFENFIPTKKKLKDSYVYIGGLSKWQCFDEILDIYGKIETEQSIFHIITFDTEKAKEKVDKHNFKSRKNIEIYTLKNRDKTPQILSKFQYGFLIRKDSPVNIVASPIKFLEYLSCGLNVIMTDAIPYYSKIVNDNKIGTVLSIGDPKTNIRPYNENARKVFEELFQRDHYVKKYAELFNR